MMKHIDDKHKESLYQEKGNVASVTIDKEYVGNSNNIQINYTDPTPDSYIISESLAKVIKNNIANDMVKGELDNTSLLII